jgi:hypothetical protein
MAGAMGTQWRTEGSVTKTVDFLKALLPFPEGHVELRAVPAGAGTQDFIAPSQLNDRRVDAFVRQHAGRNIYFGVASRRTSLNGTRENCGLLGAIFVDIDFKNERHRDGVDPAEAERRLSGFGINPSVIVKTGGGLQVFWLLNEPVPLDDIDAAWPVGLVLKRAAYVLGGDVKATDLGHVMRLPGTVNRHYPSAPVAMIDVFEPSRRYDLAEFFALLGIDSGDGPPPTSIDVIDHGLPEEDRIRRARAYLDATPPAIQGSGGDLHTYKVCRTVVRGFDLSEEATFDCLGDWNSRCEPEWDAKDLRAKIRSANKSTKVPRGAMFARDHEVAAERASARAPKDIAELNERFAIMAVGNTVVVAEFRPDQTIDEFWPFPEFKRLLIKRTTKTTIVKDDKEETKTVGLAGEWLTHPKGRAYKRLVYAMPGSHVACGPDDFNGWHGFTVEPITGDWSRNRSHWRDVICAGNDEHFAWTFNWVAALVQKPGQHAWASIVLRGGQGIGKGHFVDKMLGRLFHAQQYLHLLGANQLTAEFNEHLSGKVLVYADESTWGGDKQAASKLKGLVTESTVTVHRKFLKMVEEPSALHIIIASNNEWPIPVEWDDRRFFVLDVGDQQKQNDTYFTARLAELQNGGLGAMLHDLMDHQVDWAALRHPPDTDAKREIKALSLSPEERWFQNWLMNDAGDWHRHLPREEVYPSYTQSFGRGGQPKSIDGLGKFFSKLFRRAGQDSEWPKDHGKVKSDERFVRVVGENTYRRLPDAGRWVNAWKFPALFKCRDVFDAATGTKTDWPGEPEQQRLAS